MLNNDIKMLCLELCPVSENLAIHNYSEFLSLNPAPGLQIQSGEVLHPDVGSISICKLSPDFNFSLGKVFAVSALQYYRFLIHSTIDLKSIVSPKFYTFFGQIYNKY